MLLKATSAGLESLSGVSSSGNRLLPLTVAAAPLSDLVNHVRTEKQRKLKEMTIAKLNTSNHA